MDLRNIAIIAHVDHGKTTLVDGLLKQSKTFQDHESYMTQDLILDSNDQERERGITILAKNTSINYKGTKINIIDTPGHADFAGEVERTLNMADGAILLVDAQEGPMPQTKFVLRKALAQGLKIIVVINKIDKKNANIERTLNNVYDLFLDMVSDESQLDFPTIYAVGREEKAWYEMPEDFSIAGDLTPIFEQIISYIPAPDLDVSGPFQMQVTTLDWDAHKGKYAIGRINRGKLAQKSAVLLLQKEDIQEEATINKIFEFKGLKKVEVEEGQTGDIVALTGIENAEIGDTISDVGFAERLPELKLEDPTLSVTIGPNTSPLRGKEGKFVNRRQLYARLLKEVQTNIAMKFETDSNGQYIISGRGELHISVFLENLRREGYELEIGQPQVITKTIDGVEMEPVEEVTVNVQEEYKGVVISELSQRRGVLASQEPLDDGTTRLVYEVTTKNMIGLLSVINTLTKGTATVNSLFLRYQPLAKVVQNTRKGALISSDTGKAAAYGLRVAQDNGITFVGPGAIVYPGMIVGLHSRDKDLEINVCKGKTLSNVRSQGETAIVLATPQQMSLEKCLSFLAADELLELTPTSLRLRKSILDPTQRFRAARNN